MILHTCYCDAYYMGRSELGPINSVKWGCILGDVFRIAYIFSMSFMVTACDLDHIMNTAEDVKNWLGAYAALRSNCAVLLRNV